MEGGAMKTSTISRAAGLAVGGLFIYAGIVKTLDPAQFATDIDHYQILKWWPSIAIFSLYLPWLEIMCGAALVFCRFRCGASCVLTTLCLVFLGAIISAKIRGLDISCGCFGSSHSHSLAMAAIIDLGILAALAFILADELRLRYRS